MQVKKNTTYLILENPNGNTPQSLREHGKSKLALYASEQAGCPYDVQREVYDTGLDPLSREFVGKSKEEVDKILEERKELVDYLRQRVERTEHKNETEFLAKFKLELTHNKVVDTSNMEDYLKLYLVMRGNLLAPEEDRGNIARYGDAFYKITNKSAQIDIKKQNLKRKEFIKDWFFENRKENLQKVIDYMKYVEFVPITMNIEDSSLALDILDKKIEDFGNLEKIENAIKTVVYQDVKAHNAFIKAFRKNIIRKEKGTFMMEGVLLADTIKESIKLLKTKDNITLFDKILANADTGSVPKSTV